MLPSFIWLLVGVGLCSIELLVPTALVAVFMGLSAILVSLLALLLPGATALQVLVWMALSGLLAWLSHRFLPKKSAIDFDHSEAQALTPISPGSVGRVLYEGASWRAKCGDETSEIAIDQPVYVIGRQGTTLLVVPRYALTEADDQGQ